MLPPHFPLLPPALLPMPRRSFRCLGLSIPAHIWGLGVTDPFSPLFLVDVICYLLSILVFSSYLWGTQGDSKTLPPLPSSQNSKHVFLNLSGQVENLWGRSKSKIYTHARSYNSTAGLQTGLETVNQAVVYQYQNVFILGKLSLRLLNLCSLAFYEYVCIHIDRTQKNAHIIFWRWEPKRMLHYHLCLIKYLW